MKRTKFSLTALSRVQKLVLTIVAAAALLILPFITDDYIKSICIQTCIYIILALSLNLVTGYAGQLVLGHAAFYGIGAYVAALLMIKINVNFFISMVCGMAVSGLFGFLLSLPTLKLKGDYLAIVTLGFGEIVRLVFVNWTEMTRGPLGLSGISKPGIFGFRFDSYTKFYLLALAFVVFVVIFIKRLVESGVGMSMSCVKADEIATESIGIKPVKYKRLAFVLSASFAGMAGAVYASYITFISPTTFVYNTSVTILAMVVLGGLASIPGTVIGALVLTMIPELLRFLNDYRMLIYGALMVIMMIYRPQGFYGAERRVRNVFKKKMKGRGADE